jgi:hypothetical protein
VHWSILMFLDVPKNSQTAIHRWQCSLLAVALLAICCDRLPAQEAAGIGEVAAKQFFKEGMAAAREQEFVAAAKKFLQAIEADDSRPEYKAALSAVYLELSKTDAAWKQVREAMKTGAGDPRVASQLFAVWNAYGTKGLFQAGTVQSSIRNTLGQPDRLNKSGNNERWFYDYMGIDWADGLLYSTIDLRGIVPSNMRPLAQLRLDPDSRWRVEFRVTDRSQITTRYFVPKSAAQLAVKGDEADAGSEESIATVPEQFVIQRIFQLVEQGVSGRQWMEQMQRAAKRANPDIEWNVLEETDDRLIYEWRQAQAESWPARHEIALVMTDARDLHHAAYSDAVNQLTDESKQEWLEIFSTAKLHRYERKSESIPKKSLAPAK